MSGPAETERVQRIFDEFAPKYDRIIGFFERILFGDGRTWACSQARGETLEIAIGTGLNLPFYAPDVRLTGIELSPEMLNLARQRARAMKRKVDLRLGDAQALEFPPDSFDTVISTLTMCSIPDYRKAISEAKRVLRPGGLLVMLEHVRSPSVAVRFGQRLLNPLTVRFGADHLLREPLRVVEEQGFELLSQRRLKSGIVQHLTARKPA